MRACGECSLRQRRYATKAVRRAEARCVPGAGASVNISCAEHRCRPRRAAWLPRCAASRAVQAPATEHARGIAASAQRFPHAKGSCLADAQVPRRWAAAPGVPAWAPGARQAWRARSHALAPARPADQHLHGAGRELQPNERHSHPVGCGPPGGRGRAHRGALKTGRRRKRPCCRRPARACCATHTLPKQSTCAELFCARSTHHTHTSAAARVVGP